MKKNSKFIDGVRYDKFEIRFTLANGKRRRWLRWSPYHGQYIGSEVSRELLDTFSLAEFPKGSNVIIEKVK